MQLNIAYAAKHRLCS